MGRVARMVATVSLVVVGATATGVGLIAGRVDDRRAGSRYLTETVAASTVRRTVSDTGTVADRYTYSIRPEADPVLLAVHGEEVTSTAQGNATGDGSAGAAEDTGSYRLDSLEVRPGERVDRGDVLAVVLDQDDEEIEVEAPFDGIVRSVSSAKKSSLTEVVTLGVGRAEVVVEVSQYDVVHLSEDQNAELRLDTDGTAFDGTIAEIAQSATAAEGEAGVQTYQVIIRTSRLPKAARIGMTVDTEITITSRKDVLSVPVAAVSGTGDRPTVRVLAANGSVIIKRVTVGLVGDTRVEIAKGLTAGDKVITGDLNTPAPAGGFGGGRDDGPADRTDGPAGGGS